MTLPLELGSMQDAYVRRAFEQLSQAFPVGPGNALGSAPTTTAALPTGTVNGQDFYYRMSGGGVWHFKYDPTSAKWDFAGGPPMMSSVATAESTASLTYVALTTAGPSIALPFIGDYIVEIGFRGFDGTAGVSAFMSYDIGGTGAVDADGIDHNAAANTATADMFAQRKNGLTAVTLTAKYRVTGGTGTFGARWMTVTPVRVG